MNEMQNFNFEHQNIRTVIINEEPYFVGKDVAEVLGYSNTQKAILNHVDEEDKGVTKWDTLGGKQELIVINESGLYSLILKSKLPTAKRFKRWVTSEVLPSIRKHGMYARDELLDNPDLLLDVVTSLKEEREKRLMAEQQVNELQPKATYYDLILQNDSLVSISKIAKDYGMSGVALNKKLHELGIQFKQGKTWLLYQKYASRGYTQSKTEIVNGGKTSVMHTYWTQAGRLFIYDLLKTINIYPTIESEEIRNVY
ncbi:phage antirepressor [Listeria monocytogenes]|uniref:phage antirepressor n=1 Tax=Listeria monocytogenes TaxID=1639 RepID=UPI0009ACD5D8|nr:phage antirepressor [Listeria monocytogenes]AQZ43487.1 phage antirepressor [Listeria monocytogenes]